MIRYPDFWKDINKKQRIQRFHTAENSQVIGETCRPVFERNKPNFHDNSHKIGTRLFTNLSSMQCLPVSKLEEDSQRGKLQTSSPQEQTPNLQQNCSKMGLAGSKKFIIVHCEQVEFSLGM